MGGGHRQHEVLGEERQVVEVVVVDREGHEAGLELAGAQLLGDDLGLLLDQEHLEVGEPAQHLGHHVGQQVRRQRGEEPDADGAGLGVAGVGGDGGDGVGFVEDQPGAPTTLRLPG